MKRGEDSHLVADLGRNRCRNAGVAPEYHDYCALVVDRHDVKKVMVGLMARRGWGTLACKPATPRAWRDTRLFLVNSANQMAGRAKVKCCRAPHYATTTYLKDALDANAKTC